MSNNEVTAKGAGERGEVVTYGVTVTVDGVDYSYHVTSVQRVRELLSSITGNVTDFHVKEQTHNGFDVSYREMTVAEIGRMLSLVAA